MKVNEGDFSPSLGRGTGQLAVGFTIYSLSSLPPSPSSPLRPLLTAQKVIVVRSQFSSNSGSCRQPAAPAAQEWSYSSRGEAGEIFPLRKEPGCSEEQPQQSSH